MKGTTDPNNEYRTKCENYLTELKFEIELYKTLLTLVSDNQESKGIKMQSLLILKNLLRPELNVNKSRFKMFDSENPNIKEIISYLKLALVEILKNNDIIEINKEHVKQIVLLLGDKYFPDDWEELITYFTQIFSIKIDEVNNYINLITTALNFFSALLKQYSNKKMPSSKARYINVKSLLNTSFKHFYEMINSYYMKEVISSPDQRFIYNYINMLKYADKTLILMIEVSFSLKDFETDTQIKDMFNISIEKTEFILQQSNSLLENKQNALLLEAINRNLLKNLNLLSRLLANGTAQILFYSKVEQYSKIIISIINYSDNYSPEILKIALFSLYKIITTDYFKERKSDNLNLLSYSNNDAMMNINTISNNTQFQTPEKKNLLNQNNPNNLSLSNNYLNVSYSNNQFNSSTYQSGKHSLVSPTKFKNYESQTQLASESFYTIFTVTTIKNLFEILVKTLPLILNKDLSLNENFSCDIMNDLEQELNPMDNYDTDQMNWQVIYFSLIESFFKYFKDISLPFFIKSLFNPLIKAVKDNDINITDKNNLKNLQLIDSVISVVNLFPKLHINKVIGQTEIIDCASFFDTLEILISKNHMFIKTYIFSINRWCDILVSNNFIQKYINNIALFLVNSNDDEVLLDGCLALNSIISKLECFFVKDSIKFSLLNLSIDPEDLKDRLNKEINWSELLLVVAKISFDKLLNENTSAENVQILVKLLTSLLEKSHMQDNNAVLKVISTSKLKDIILCSNEFTHKAFIDMFKVLIYSFSESVIIVDFCLGFIEHSLSKKIDFANLNYFLFFLKVVGKKSESIIQDIKNNDTTTINNINSISNENREAMKKNYSDIHLIVKRSSCLIANLVKNCTENYSNPIIFHILEEAFALGIFENNEFMEIISITTNKFSNIHQLYKHIISQIEEEENSNNSNGILNSASKSNNLNRLNLVASDINEYKCFLTHFLITSITKYQNEFKTNEYFRKHFFGIINSYFYDLILPNSYINTMYNSSLLGILNKMFCYQEDIFLEYMNIFVKENNISIQKLIECWLNKMENSYSNDTRKLNIVTVCLLLTKIDKEFFLNMRNAIFQICLVLVHSEMMKKLRKNMINYENNSFTNNTNDNNTELRTEISGFDIAGIKTILCSNSIRKQNIISDDILFKIDIHDLFVEKFKETILRFNISYDYLINNYLTNVGLVERLNEILGLTPVELS